MAGSRSLAVAPALALGLVGCQLAGQIPTLPTKSPSPTATVAPIAIPVIRPTPVPTPTPAPTPTPGPNPTPTPAPAPSMPPSTACGLPPSNPPTYSCDDSPSQFYGRVDRALNRVTQQHPEVFDFDRKVCDNCYFVKDVDRYHALVIAELASDGLCSIYDGEELGVKETNSFEEQFDIILASNHMRRGYGSYRGTCRPSWF